MMPWCRHRRSDSLRSFVLDPHKACTLCETENVARDMPTIEHLTLTYQNLHDAIAARDKRPRDPREPDAFDLAIQLWSRISKKWLAETNADAYQDLGGEA